MQRNNSFHIEEDDSDSGGKTRATTAQDWQIREDDSDSGGNTRANTAQVWPIDEDEDDDEDREGRPAAQHSRSPSPSIEIDEEGELEPLDVNPTDIEECGSIGEEEIRRALERADELAGVGGYDQAEAVNIYKRRREPRFKTHAPLASKLRHMIRLDEFQTAFHLYQESRIRHQQRVPPLQSPASSMAAQQPACEEERRRESDGAEVVSSVSLWGVSFATCPNTGALALVSTCFSSSGFEL